MKNEMFLFVLGQDLIEALRIWETNVLKPKISE